MLAHLALPDLETGSLAARLAASARHRPDVGSVLAWLAKRRQARSLHIEQVPIEDLEGWALREDGNLAHDTGRFFTVEGLRAWATAGPVREWTQPILHQPDVAVLGILAKEIDGVLHFLMQAKIEPGNVNSVQLSPTVQATPSNYFRVHRGNAPRYIEQFIEARDNEILVDVLQSEQGAWFYRKRNRNIILEVKGAVEAHEDFVWLTLGQLYELLGVPHTVNMDARTVLACLPSPSTAPNASTEAPAHRLAQIRRWLINHKAANGMDATLVPLTAVSSWSQEDGVIAHPEGRYFEIIGARVHAPSREVSQWCQPLLRPCSTGLAAFVLRRFGGVLHVLARADLRPGYRDVAEIGPTVQCQPDNHRHLPAHERPLLLDLVLEGRLKVHVDVEQSEEGGRFRSALTRYLIVEAGPDVELPIDERLCWVSLAQLAQLVGTSYQLAIEARCLLLLLHAWLWEQRS
ncbi:MAG: NDP-hexose 2,3-dehydratase family protein [Pseudomonadota bacterium]